MENAAQMLHEEERLRLILDASLDAHIAMDAGNHIVEWNEQATQIFGWSREEAIGRPLSETIIPERYRQMHLEGLQRFIETGEQKLLNRRVEVTGLCRDGSEVPVELSIVPIRIGDGWLFSASLRDLTQYKATEAAMQRQTLILQSVLDSMAEGVVVADTQLKPLLVNRSAEQMLGISIGQEVGQLPYEVLLADQETSIPTEDWPIARAVRGEAVDQAELDVRRPGSGQQAWISANARPLRGADGTIHGGVAVFRDVTESKRFEETLKQRAALLNLTPDAIMVRDLDHRITFWNKGAEHLYGYTREEALGKPVQELLQTRFPVSLQAILDMLYQEGAWQGELRHTARNGQRITVLSRWALERDSDNRPVRILESNSDITQRKNMEMQLARLAYDNQLLLDSTGEGIYGIDENGNCTFINRAGAALLGYKPEEVIGKNNHTLFHYSHSDGSPYPVEACPIYQVLHHKKGRRVADEVFWRKDGTSFPVEYTAWPIIENGQIRGAVATFTDITVRKEAEEELYVAKQEAEYANQAKSQFLANMSHELRTPLNAVIGYSEMLMEEAEDGALENQEATDDLKKIHTAGQHLLSLINDVLDLSKIEAGRMELYLETVDVPELVRQVADTARALAEKNGNQLVIKAPDDLGRICADVTKLRQVLLNLLSNAAKFTKDGTVTLQVSPYAMNGIDSLRFDISDTGIGISVAQMEKLFQPFSQADASTTRQFGGTGLGLALSRRMCQLMGGDITVQSAPGKGSTFTITLPRHVSRTAKHDADQAVTRTEVAHEAGRNTVLVIDDDEAARELIKRLLEREGFAVETAAGGEEGLRLARLLKPAAITLDVVMPRMDGWAVLSALKSDPELCPIPVVMMTMQNELNRGYALGANDYLTKPIQRDQLHAALRKFQCPDPPCPILVVEDDAATRELLRNMLEKEGWKVDEAENGSVALDRVAVNRPSLILLDLMMPEMNGFAFVHELHKEPAWRSIPIIVVTAKDLTPEERQRLNGYAEQILEKGDYEDTTTMLERVREIFASRQHQETASTQSTAVPAGQ